MKRYMKSASASFPNVFLLNQIHTLPFLAIHRVQVTIHMPEINS